ncbi:LPXTG cell wall anchor domain-containing protein [Intestinibacter sp.]
MKIPKKIVSALAAGVIIASSTAPTVALASEVLSDSNLQVSETITENEVLETEETDDVETDDVETNEETEVKDENANEDADIETDENVEIDEDIEELSERSADLTIDKAIQNTVDYYKNHNNQLSEFWHLVGLRGVGQDITSSAYTLPKWDANLIDEETKVISDAGYILGIIARGEDPKNYYGKNVAQLLASKQKYYYEYNSATGQYDKNEWGFGSFNGANANIWAIIALEIANQEYDKEAAFNTLLECQNSTSGGFGLSASWSSTDMTGMALIALSYFNNDPAFSARANQSIEKALGYIARAKNENGTFNTSDRPGVEDGNSTSMAITGLLSVGENLDSERWSNVKTGLLELQLTEDMTIETWMGEEQHYRGEFYWRKPNQINDTATKQALVALGDLIDGETAWKQLEREYDELEAKRDNVDNDDKDDENNNGDVDNGNDGDQDNDNNDDVDNGNNGDQDNGNNNNGNQGSNGSDKGDYPQTGDTSILGEVLLGIASIAGLGALKRKRK